MNIFRAVPHDVKILGFQTNNPESLNVSRGRRAAHAYRAGALSACAAAALVFLLGGCSSGGGSPVVSPPVTPPTTTKASQVPESTYFSTAAEQAYSTYQLPGDGDLWPSCWASDNNLYAANGDGTAFAGGPTRFDMAVSRIAGAPPNLSGTTLATDVGTNWSGISYNRKPTGMLCANNAIYLAFQNLNTNFGDVPAASIAMSTDGGTTWAWDKTAPMFGTPGTNGPNAYLFTTIFFVDYGKNSANAIDGYVYAYGLDKNWREQQSLYLARVPATSIQDRSTWQFYAGLSGSAPTWTKDITAKVAVLLDNRLLYPKVFDNGCPASQPVVGQGGVVYDAPLKRYIFSSWSCTTHELYEAPNPWGPWSHFLSNDFGPLRLTQNRGQYGTSIPSKFISADGLTAYVQSNVCCGGDSYTFSLRKLFLQPYASSQAGNALGSMDLATLPGTRAISKSTHFGSLCGLNCSDQLVTGSASGSEDDFDQETKSLDWWGYTWPQTYNLNQVVYRTGGVYPNGGWFASNLRVQVRQNFQWVDVTSTVNPAYPYSNAAGALTAYTFNFPNIAGDGVRIIGVPGGTSSFTSINQLGAFYTTASTSTLPTPPTNLIADPGFELQTTNVVSFPWKTEGPDAHGIDTGGAFSHTGGNDAWIRDSTTNFNSITQTVAVQPNTTYTLTGWIRNNFGNNIGYFGVRNSDGITVLKETQFGAAPTYTLQTVTFNSGANATVTVYAGFFGQGTDLYIQLDDVSLMQ